MKTLRLFLAAMMLALVAACAAPMAGLTNAETFRESAGSVMQATDAVITLTRALLRVNKLTPDDAQSILSAAELSRDGIAIARSVQMQQGDAAGTARLRRAANELDRLNAYLVEKGK